MAYNPQYLPISVMQLMQITDMVSDKGVVVSVLMDKMDRESHIMFQRHHAKRTLRVRDLNALTVLEVLEIVHAIKDLDAEQLFCWKE